MSNLCQEITLPTDPIQNIEGGKYSKIFIRWRNLLDIIGNYKIPIIQSLIKHLPVVNTIYLDFREQLTNQINKDKDIGEIALCILSAINVGKIKNMEELKHLCDLSVRALDELIDIQEYPVIAAEVATKARRSLGIGFIGLAHYLAKNGWNYDEPQAWKLVHDLTEAFQYYLIQATVNLAKEKGPCKYSDKTKYSQGILPIDTYKKDVDEIVKK